MTTSLDGDTAAISRWAQVSAWTRSVLVPPTRPFFPKPAAPGLSEQAFGSWFPGEWRGKSNYAPLKARLLKRLLGPGWYEMQYVDDPFAIWIVPERFSQWKATTLARKTVEQNLQLVLGDSSLRASLSGIGWAKLLQAALDFAPSLAQSVWDLASKANLSDTESALLFQTY